MSYLDRITTGPKRGPRRTFLYGTHGIGKTTWAAKWPDPLLIDIEGGSGDIDATRISDFTGVKDIASVVHATTDSDRFKTIVVDSIDWFEKMVQDELVADDFDDSFGKGTIEVGRVVSRLTGLLDKVIDSGKHVVILGHSHVKTVTRPDGSVWSRHEPRLTKYASAAVCEWSDELLFADVAVSVQTKQVGQKKVSVGKSSSTRTLHTVGSATYEAKHRANGLNDKYDLSDFDSYFSNLVA